MLAYTMKVERVRVSDEGVQDREGKFNGGVRWKGVDGVLGHQGVDRLIAAKDLEEDREVRGGILMAVGGEVGRLCWQKSFCRRLSPNSSPLKPPFGSEFHTISKS